MPTTPKVVKVEPPKPLDYNTKVSSRGEITIKFNQKIKRRKRELQSFQSLFTVSYLPYDAEGATSFDFDFKQLGEDFITI